MRFREYLSSLSEMTMRAGNLRDGIEPQRKYYEPLIIKNGKYIGDLKTGAEIFKIYQSELQEELQYGLYDDDILIAFFNGTMSSIQGLPKFYYLEQMLTKSDYAGRHLSAKLLVFLKTREKIPVVFGNVHSEDTIQNIRKIARTVPVLTVKWVNIETGDIDEFKVEKDEEDVKHLYGIDGWVPWRILIEAEKTDTQLTHFISESSQWDLRHDYNIWIRE